MDARMKNIINTMAALVGTAFTWVFGKWDLAIQVLICFMVMDYCTGILKGFVNKQLSSEVGFKGIARKAVIFVVLIVSVMIDRLLNTGSWIFRTIVCYFYVANEGISVLENCTQLGLPIPKQITDALVQLREGQKKETKGSDK
jgi:toxin secretion/phage lysis holin